MRRWFAVNSKCFPTTAKGRFFRRWRCCRVDLSTQSRAQGPALTTISGTVYRADGTAASGTVLISWPSFETAGGDAVAAGNLAVTIGTLGRSARHWFPTWVRLRRGLTMS